MIKISKWRGDIKRNTTAQFQAISKEEAQRNFTQWKTYWNMC